jgi:hypothetical protein
MSTSGTPGVQVVGTTCPGVEARLGTAKSIPMIEEIARSRRPYFKIDAQDG